MGNSLVNYIPYHFSMEAKECAGIPGPVTASTIESPMPAVAPRHNPYYLDVFPHPFYSEAFQEILPNVEEIGPKYVTIIGKNFPPFVEERKRLLDAGLYHMHSDAANNRTPSGQNWKNARTWWHDPTGIRPGWRARRYLVDDLMEICTRDPDRPFNQCLQQAWANALLGSFEVRPPRGEKPVDRVFTHLGWVKAVEPLHRGMNYERDQNGRRRFHWQRRDPVTNAPVGSWHRADPRFAVPVVNDVPDHPLGPPVSWEEYIKNHDPVAAVPIYPNPVGVDHSSQSIL
eukprot:TRINITY_DN22123_c0_g1_i1.p1 TRINITY_DN22123_c0_g1~~TRINITY_DN22123_c0_g1_i1.p1  ORF type:complete len:286 (-),score=25.50 TRINITY_DN22123_c0_g1_i1:214-1071(-)